MSKLQDLRVGLKLAAALTCILMIVMLLGGKSLWSLDRIDTGFRNYESAAEQAMATEELRLAVFDFVGAAREYVARDSGARLQVAFDLYDEIQTQVLGAVDQSRDRYGDAVKATAEEIDAFRTSFVLLTELRTERNRLVAEHIRTPGTEARRGLADFSDRALQAGRAEIAARASKAAMHLLLARDYAARYLESFRQADLDRARLEIRQAQAQSEPLGLRGLDAGVTERLAIMAAALQEISTVYETERAAADRFFGSELDVLESRTAEMLAAAEAVEADSRDALAAERRGVFFTVPIAIAFAALVALLAGLWLTRSVAHPIRGMTAAMGRLADGDTTAKIPAIGRRDEVGQMAQAMQVFKESMIEAERLTAERTEAQEAQIARSRRVEDLTGTFDAAVAQVLRGVSEAAEEMNATAQSMSSISEETRVQATSASGASTQASANVQTVA
ncbi:HAMP domain-containing protein [Algihabitans albus]|uniref:HAMP domain-containing protein n=1 Tax=Algihabitans albus TaxID=2164067 RepID=UPI000E5C5836|nr:HAMP domain-containing protein [Algihabitans albus]